MGADLYERLSNYFVQHLGTVVAVSAAEPRGVRRGAVC